MKIGFLKGLLPFLPDRTLTYPGEPVVMPRWLSNRAIAMYFVAVAICGAMFFSHFIEWYFLMAGVIEVVGFFYFSHSLSKSWSKIRSDKAFGRKLFWTALVIRIIYVFFSFWMYNKYNPYNAVDHYAFEFSQGDVGFYHEAGVAVADGIRKGSWNLMENLHKGYGEVGYDDSGYAMYLGVIYFFADNSLLIVRLIKAIWSALTVLLMYRLASRCFGEQTGRLAGIFCMLMPNLIYYCGIHLKETEMVFLCVYFVEEAEQMLRSRQFTAWKIIPIALVAAILFMFRTPLGIVAVLSLFFTLAVSSEKVVSWGKRIIVGFLTLCVVGLSMGNRVYEEMNNLSQKVTGGEQRTNMEWRSTRNNGNQFAKYAGAAVFAPLIFTIPFPTMTVVPTQEGQRMIHGGNYVKNVLSVLTIMALFLLLVTDEWRKYLMPLSFMLGYLVVLALSTFAQSERFHMPSLPFELMFAAYLVPLMNKKSKNIFNIWTIALVLICVAWQWFKMKGRGLA